MKRIRCMIALLCVSLLVLVLAAISFPVVNVLVKKEIKKKVVLKNGSDTYDMWVEPSVPIYMQFYVFDLQNPAEVMNGSKPIVKQKGPYTYEEHRQKVDIVDNKNGTVTYRQIKTYHFDRNMSVGPDSDTFTTLNLPLVTLSSYAKWNGPRWNLYTLLGHDIFGKFFENRTIREMAFGYQDPLLAAGMLIDPERFYTDLVGVMAGKNNTDDGVYTIFTGESDISKLGIINRYNGSSSLKFWSSKSANMINGSDGTVVPPFSNKEEKLYMFSTDVCRSVYGEYSSTVTSEQGLSLHRYTSKRDVIANASENPANAGFCTPKGNCMGSGVVNLTTCQQLDSFSVPIIASFPHFYLADKEYVEAVQGMHPDAAQHSTNIDLEPTTGIVMQISKRLQINVYFENITGIKYLEAVNPVVYPILWINESVKIDDSHALQVQKELSVIAKIRIGQYVAFAVGGLLLVVAAALYIHGRRKEATLSYDINTTDEDSSRLIT